jgi:hypothetical protein
MDYFFSVNVNFSSYMQTHINLLGLTSGTLLNIGTDSSTSPMTVDLTFNNSLSDADLVTLNAYMAAYADPTVSAGAIAAIIVALNTDANVMTVARAKIKTTIPYLDVITLLQVCTLLGINPNT